MEETITTHYPSYDVMNEADAWDDHTQAIVRGRLQSGTMKPEREGAWKRLTAADAALLRAAAGVLVDDRTPDVLEWVVSHVDQTLHADQGEGQRKAGVPAQRELMLGGLRALERAAEARHAAPFADLAPAAQERLLQESAAGTAEPAAAWEGVPPKPFFEKLLRLTLEAYASHPRVWSEIGYAGPAYPRGYVRTQRGQLDPWEARWER